MDEKEDQFCVKAYFDAWNERIADLGRLISSSEFKHGKSAAHLLSFCYIEALGKFYFFTEGAVFPGSNKILVDVLKFFFDVSKTDAEKICRYYRNDFVHSGPTCRSGRLHEAGEEIINVEKTISGLNKILIAVQQKQWSFKKIMLVIEWSNRK